MWSLGWGQYVYEPSLRVLILAFSGSGGDVEGCVPPLVPHRAPHPRAHAQDGESQAAQDGGEHGVDFHTVPTPAAVDDLVKQVLGVEREQPVAGVVQRETLKRDAGEVVPLDVGQEAERVSDHVPGDILGSVPDVVEVAGELVGGVAGGRH